MKFSIITVCFNSQDTIEDTIKSVVNQTYQDIEYIIVDGGSKDGTLNILKKYEDRIAKIVSEKDNGIYDAINKGIKMSTGEVVAILNSDDLYANNQIIETAAKKMIAENTDALYGDLKYVQHDDLTKTARYWKSGTFKRFNFLLGWMPPHPTFFLKRSVYESLGGYVDSFKSAADYELMLRTLFRYRVSVSYLPKVMVLMREGGVSNASLKNRLRANLEDQKAWVINGLQSFFFTTWLKPIRKIPQFVFKGN